ncbi:MAG: pyridoxamine 5'-phosphate oxidase family protein [Cytophagaceae bacterium]|nr:pyridoxamine 5'-phosphate oxidase family protein [Cytophagaceae bacterium]
MEKDILKREDFVDYFDLKEYKADSHFKVHKQMAEYFELIQDISETNKLSVIQLTDYGKRFRDNINYEFAVYKDYPKSTLKQIGIEITKLLIKTGKFRATARLNTIAKKVVQYFKEEKNIALSVLIDVYDERKFSPNWNEILDYCYNPGFDKIGTKNKEVEDAIIEAITNEGIPELGLKKVNITVSPRTLVVSIVYWIDSIEKLYKKVNTFILTCVRTDGYPHTKAAVPRKHRESINEMYFCTNSSSKFVAEVSQNPKASVYFYSRKLIWKGCLLKGKMEIVSDPAVKEKYWQKKFKNAYPEKSYTDPDFCVLRFTLASGSFYSWYKPEDFEI